MDTELGILENLLRAQWLRLRDWVDERELATSDAPSVLDGWTVADLVAHLGLAMGTLTRAEPAPPDAVPATLAELVAGYPGRADEIVETTRAGAREIAGDPLPAVERMAEAAFARLDELRGPGGDPVVLTRRGTLRLSTLVQARLLELVVHGDDLVRSTGDVPGGGPLEPGAVTVVAEALRDVLVERGGPDLEVADPLAWLRVACGRVEPDAAAVQAALRPRHLADGMPDLADWLPLL